jgi:co-chaperonin GroES (HSP10)
MPYRPIGARVLVEDIITTLSLEARGEKIGLAVITDERNRPRPTCGRIVALGSDPMLREEGLEVGQTVQFDKLAGRYVYLGGKEYRSLEYQEIIGVEDVTPQPGTPQPTGQELPPL